MITAPKRLLRQRSSTGYRTTVKGHELLAKNAIRDTVLVLKSGVQLERLSAAKTDDSHRLNHVAKLKNSSEAQYMRWSVKIVIVGSSDDETSLNQMFENATWSLRTVPRGIRDALSTGLFLPGTVWRLWIPGEHAGSLEPQEYDSGLRIIDVTVTSLDEKHRDSIFAMILALFAAIVSAFLCFLTDYYRRIFNTKTSIVRGSTRPRLATPVPLEDGSETAPIINTTKVRMDFVVDLEELDGSVLEIVEQGKCAHWFLRNLDAFAQQNIGQTNNKSGSVSALPCAIMKVGNSINASSSDLDQENEHVLKYIQKTSNSKTSKKFRVFLNVSNFAVVFSADPRTLEDKTLICIGHVIEGEDAFIALNNCDDGGIVSSILQL